MNTNHFEKPKRTEKNEEMKELFYHYFPSIKPPLSEKELNTYRNHHVFQNGWKPYSKRGKDRPYLATVSALAWE